MILYYNIKIKTLNNKNSNFNFFILEKKKKIKKYIITKASFKYKKKKEQYALIYTKYKFKWKNYKISPKIFEVFLIIYFLYNNKYMIKIKKK